MQMPQKSTVLLVRFQPTVAFYTWHCLQMLSETGSATSYVPGTVDQRIPLACDCASILSSNPAATTDLTSLLPSALLLEAALPVSNSAGHLQDPANESSLSPQLRMCMSFLTGLLQPGCPEGSLQVPSQASATKSVPVPVSAVAACTQPTKPVPEPDSNGQSVCDSPAASHISSDQQHMATIMRLKRALGGVVMTSKLVYLAEHVKHKTSLKERQGPLMILISQLLADVTDTAGKLRPGTDMPSEDLQNMRHLIRALMSNALDILRQALQQAAAGQAPLSDGPWSLFGTAEQAVRCCLYSSSLLCDAALCTFSSTGTTLTLAVTTVNILPLRNSNIGYIDCIAHHLTP